MIFSFVLNKVFVTAKKNITQKETKLALFISPKYSRKKNKTLNKIFEKIFFSVGFTKSALKFCAPN